MGRSSTLETLLKAGNEVFLEHGFNHSGIDAVLRKAGVPKGSFYHYFASKEDFGLKVLDDQASRIEALMVRHLGDRGVKPLDRLKNYGQAVVERLESGECRNGCLVGNFSHEVAGQSEAFRTRLAEILRDWVRRYESCLQEAQDCGDIPADLKVSDLAEFWVCGWQGAVMRAKTLRDTTPLRNFLNLMFGYVLRIR